MGTEPTNKKALLDATLSALDKKYGKGIVMKLSNQAVAKVPVVSTGSLSLDHALGIQGLPYQRITEIYGPEASGKTTLSWHVMAEIQKKGGTAILIDTEHAFDKAYAQSLGVDTNNLLICQPDYGEQALNVAEDCIRSGAVQLLVLDSVSALVPEAELKGSMGDHNIGAQARLMSQAMRKLTAIIHKTGVVCIFINQIRHKVGVFFGSPETTSGGNALKFYASVRLEVRRGKKIINKANEIIGHTVKVKVVKNKLAPPFKEAQFDLVYGKGISRSGELADWGLATGILQKKGTWFYYGADQLAQGRENTIAVLETNPELANKIYQRLRQEGTPILNQA